MDIITRLADPAQWQAFLAYKQAAGNETEQTLAELAELIRTEAYLPVVRGIRAGDGFPLPERKELNKAHSDQKRVVYTFPKPEGYVLKLMAWLLHDYDDLFADNLYSFRRDRCARDIVSRLARTPGIWDRYVYKTDIHNYFNSVRLDLLRPLLERALPEEETLVGFLMALLENPWVIRAGERVQDREKGIMAGTPTASFLANLYLSELDWRFQRSGLLYARYSDDLIVFADTPEELEASRQIIRDTLSHFGLTANERKTTVSLPGEGWSYLGFLFQDGEVDIAPASLDKLKGKMRRKARALCRWRQRKGASEQRAVQAYLRYFNRKLFENPVKHELTWSRWYFPLLTTDRSLHRLDQYMQECIRYIASGRHTKGNYRLRYETMKEWGYCSLVNRYHKKDGAAGRDAPAGSSGQ